MTIIDIKISADCRRQLFPADVGWNFFVGETRGCVAAIFSAGYFISAAGWCFLVKLASGAICLSKTRRRVSPTRRKNIRRREKISARKIANEFHNGKCGINGVFICAIICRKTAPKNRQATPSIFLMWCGDNWPHLLLIIVICASQLI